MGFSYSGPAWSGNSVEPFGTLHSFSEPGGDIIVALTFGCRIHDYTGWTVAFSSGVTDIVWRRSTDGGVAEVDVSGPWMVCAFGISSDQPNWAVVYNALDFGRTVQEDPHPDWNNDPSGWDARDSNQEFNYRWGPYDNERTTGFNPSPPNYISFDEWVDGPPDPAGPPWAEDTDKGESLGIGAVGVFRPSYYNLAGMEGAPHADDPFFLNYSWPAGIVVHWESTDNPPNEGYFATDFFTSIAPGDGSVADHFQEGFPYPGDFTSSTDADLIALSDESDSQSAGVGAAFVRSGGVPSQVDDVGGGVQEPAIFDMVTSANESIALLGFRVVYPKQWVSETPPPPTVQSGWGILTG